MEIRLEKIKFYVTNGTKNDVFTDTYEGVLRTIREMKDFIGKEDIVLGNAKTLEELEKKLEELSSKNKDRYEITVIRPTIIKYQDKEILFYSEEEIKKYFEKNYPDFYEENEIGYITDSYELLKLGIEIKEIWNAEFNRKEKENFKYNEKNKDKEI